MDGKPFAILLIAFGGAMILIALLQRQENIGRSRHGQSEYSSVQSNVERYRQELGDKLNRDRIAVQHNNILDSRQRDAQANGPVADPVLRGLPLAGERPFAHQEATYTYHDLNADIRAQLEFDRTLQTWENEARALYIAQFIDRARSMGYKVQIDEDYNVTYESIEARSPQNFSLRLPYFVLAPSCPL